MQHGDLALHIQSRAVIVIEGVLCQVTPIVEKKRFRDEKVTGYHINWHEVPLKRCIYMKEHWPDTAQDFVTFISSDFLDTALEFLDTAHIPYDAAMYATLEHYANLLRYQNDVIKVFDSDFDRLDRFGQKGVAVVRGYDF